LTSNKTYRYRIYPTELQKKALEIQFGHSRYIYNKGLSDRIHHYEKTGKGLSYYDQTKHLVKLKKEKSWLQDADSQVLQQKLIDLDRSYKNFFQKRAGYPKFKNKNGSNTIRYPQRFKFSGNKTYLPKVGWIRTVFHRNLIGTPKFLTVIKTKTTKYFIAVLCKQDFKLQENTNNKSIGIDLGVINFVTLSNGDKISNPKFLKQTETRLKREQRKLAKKKIGSSNRNKQRIKIAKLHEKVSNQRKDFLHKLSSNLVSDYMSIACESLDIPKMLKNRIVSNGISDSGWGIFVNFLIYKTKLLGREVLFVDKFFPSSKTCHKCGHINKQLMMSERSWECPNCHSILDRDVNAAINILIQATGGVPESKAC
jgi:putative transposase